MNIVLGADGDDTFHVEAAGFGKFLGATRKERFEAGRRSCDNLL